MKAIATLALAAAFSQAACENFEFNWMVESNRFTVQPVVLYKIGELRSLFGTKNFNFNVVSVAGYDIGQEQPNLGGGFVYPLKIAENGFLNLGGRVAFQAYKKPEFGFIVGVAFKF